MSNFLKVEDHNELVRDPYSKAILHVDRTSLLEHRKKKQVLKEMFNNTERLNKLEDAVDEIKQMLEILIKTHKVD
jgi:hypothetical protein